MLIRSEVLGKNIGKLMASSKRMINWGLIIIMKKVEELPAKCRAIFKASLYEGKTYSEIAEEQNINVTTVRVQMKIALTKLRESLGTPYMIAILMFL